MFINGCFWHLHDCPAGRHAPATNAEFWAAKRNRTRERDGQHAVALRALDWDSLVLWKYELGDRQALEETLARFLGPPSKGKPDRNAAIGQG